jgi:Bardet-Biedl syndrome 1 protein
VASVHTVLDVPVAIASFYPELSTPRIPSVAVAAGSFVYVYRNLRPYMKFTCPQVAVSHEEIAHWDDFWANKIDVQKLIAGLTELRDARGIQLSSRGADFVALSDEKVCCTVTLLICSKLVSLHFNFSRSVKSTLDL